MSHILFVNVAEHGHVRPSLPLVTELVRRGHRVSHTSTPGFAGRFTAAGAEPVPYTSAVAAVDTAEVFARDEDGAAAHLLYLEENLALLRGVTDAYGTERPDAVVYGDFPVITGGILTERWGVPAVRSSAAFASDERYSFSRDLVDSAGFDDPLTMPRFRDRLAELLAAEGVRASTEDFWNRVEDFNLVFVPQSFQVHGEGFDERFSFVGPCTDGRAPADGWHPPEGGPPVVLVSLGTTFNRGPEFFRACARSFEGSPWHVVITLGGLMEPQEVGPLPPNVEVHPWLPHAAVLEHARVCVTHGGTGTLMEAFSRGCPVVCVPHSPDVLPMVRRVDELALGTVLSPEETGAEDIRARVERTARDGRVLERVRALRDEIHAGGPAHAADELEAFLSGFRGGRAGKRRTVG
ncbi:MULTISPECIES: macrolide family glycosyltransferase [Nocardiopsis]|uniref:Glycosyl transferase n=1 Tax=Nocardiopsis sinuspersici TaxID=501010 RepID=A0A1V3BYK1_9ACTN|nr:MULTISPECIES: macrolide family glycosyltransferase [Nocardiopsis]OOC53329.1 glycosyl transferase [Nocardiopsis sinuspersici]